jgi:hypothetical protein
MHGFARIAVGSQKVDEASLRLDEPERQNHWTESIASGFQ